MSLEPTPNQSLLGAQPRGSQYDQYISGRQNAITQSGSATVNNFYQNLPSYRLDSDTLIRAQQQFAALPLDTIPAVTTSLPDGSYMPLSRNPFFVGRMDKLLALSTMFKGVDAERADQARIVAISGQVGMGKTQLTSEFVHRYGQFFLGGVFWLSFADASSIQSQVVECYTATGLDMQLKFGSLPLNDQLRLVLSAWQSPFPRLLIFDNCRDERLLAQWRPPTGGCRILITSNRTTWAPELEVKILPLSKLSRGESIELLRQYCPNFSNADLGAIANDLDDLPLALSLAGSYLRTYHRTNLANPNTYLTQLHQMTPLQHISLKGKGSTYSPTGHELNIEQTFALNYELLENDDPVDAKSLTLLARAAFFAPGEPIPRNLLRRTLGQVDDNPMEELQFEDALERLQTLGLLENQEDGSLWLHRLVVAFIQMRVGTTGTEAQTVVEQVLLERADNLNSKGYSIPMLALQPHLRLVTNVALERGDKRAANLCTQLGIHLHMIGEYPEAVSYTEQALVIKKIALEAEHPNVAISCNNLAALYHAQGKYILAEHLIEQALTIQRNALGAENPDVAMSFNNLAALYQAQGKYEQAE